jgi:hypothetical protein
MLTSFREVAWPSRSQELFKAEFMIFQSSSYLLAITIPGIQDERQNTQYPHLNSINVPAL